MRLPDVCGLRFGWLVVEHPWQRHNATSSVACEDIGGIRSRAATSPIRVFAYTIGGARTGAPAARYRG